MGRRSIALVAIVVVILGVSAFLLRRGGGRGIVGGVPPEAVNRGDNNVPQEGDDDGGDEGETEVYGYWDLLDKSAGIRGKPAEDVWVRWNEILTK